MTAVIDTNDYHLHHTNTILLRELIAGNRYRSLPLVITTGGIVWGIPGMVLFISFAGILKQVLDKPDNEFVLNI